MHVLRGSGAGLDVHLAEVLVNIGNISVFIVVVDGSAFNVGGFTVLLSGSICNRSGAVNVGDVASFNVVNGSGGGHVGLGTVRARFGEILAGGCGV